MNHYNLGLDLGGTTCAVLAGCLSGDCMNPNAMIMETISFPTETNKGKDHTLNRIFDAMDTLVEKYKTEDYELQKIGISCGGPLDDKKGIIMGPPNLPGWKNVPITDILKSRYSVPVKLQNDANACALAEWKLGAGKGCQHMIFLTMGTGLGAGLILNGKLYTGASGMAGEVGHIRLYDYGPVGYGKMGSLEGFCSGEGIAQLAQSMVREKLQQGEKVSFFKDSSNLELITAKSVAEAAEKGDPLALNIYEEVGVNLGKALALLIDILNPEKIIIGSIFERNHTLLTTKIQETLERECLWQNKRDCTVTPALLGDLIGSYAALITAEYEE